MVGKHADKAIAGNAETSGGWRGNRWRVAVWAAVALILLLPSAAMQFTDEVSWGVADFALASVLLIGTGITCELAMRKAGNIAYRAAVGVALAAALLLVWINLAVGIIGDEDYLANVMYMGVLAAGIIGAIIARFQAHGMVRALFGTALAQALVAVIALAFRLGSPASGPLEILTLTEFFVVLWVGSALLFREAMRGGPDMKLRVHKILSVLTIAIGLVLMVAKIYADSEPGAIPLLLVVLGTVWYFITHVRTQSHHK